jgi:hypothetical protein
MQPITGLRDWSLSLLYRASFGVRNFVAKGSVISPGPEVVVSLTSFGERTRLVHLAIESIARGTVRPSRIVLWLDDAAVVTHPPRALRRLQSRGLEIELTEDFGPHKKYYPYVISNTSDSAVLVTADDDTFYPRRWLSDLLLAHTEVPDAVVAHRSRKVLLEDGRLRPYSTWPPAPVDYHSAANLAIGVGGVLYPPRVQRFIAQAGRTFMDVAPRADDLWLHACAIRCGARVLGLNAISHWRFVWIRPFRTLPTLAMSNVDGGGNDRQAALVYGTSDLALLAQATAAPSGGDTDMGVV